MARNFPTAGNKFISGTLTTAMNTAGTIALWVNPSWSAGDGLSHAFCSWGGDFITTRILEFQRRPDNKIYVGWNKAGGPDERISLVDTGYFTSGTWDHHAFTYTTTQCDYWFNGVSQISSITASTSSATTSLFIGKMNNIISVYAADSSIAEVARWDNVLLADEIVSLAKGYSPALINPAQLVDYIPIIGRFDPEINLLDANTLALTNAPPNDVHPRMIYARRRREPFTPQSRIQYVLLGQALL